MKTHLIYSLSLFFILISCQGSPRFAKNSSSGSGEVFEMQSIKSLPNDSLLNAIQSGILNAFAQSNISKSDKELSKIENQLINLNPKETNPIIQYWFAFTCYYHSLFFVIQKDDKEAGSILEKGMEQLENISHKNSEHYALLSMMQSFSFQFTTGFEAPFLSKKVKQNALKAIELDSLNLRAWFVLGSNDYYTPEKYGGGKKAEEYLKGAISLKDQTIENPYLPSWGKNSAYELLIRLYIRQNKIAEALQYYKEAHSLFPDDYMINKLAAELIK